VGYQSKKYATIEDKETGGDYLLFVFGHALNLLTLVKSPE
jgi:hypothetical protein